MIKDVLETQNNFPLMYLSTSKKRKKTNFIM